MKTLLLLILMSVAWGTTFAQDKPKTDALILTPDQKLTVRSAQVKLLQAQARAQALQAQLDQARQDVQAVAAEINKAVEDVFAAHKVTQKEYALCDQPGPGGCERAPAGDLTLQRRPPAEDPKKAEEKK